jgi:hypothetical protein
VAFFVPKSRTTNRLKAKEFSVSRGAAIRFFAFYAMTRKIFPALLIPFARQLLDRPSRASGMSRSDPIRHLMLKEVAQQKISLDRQEKPL